MKRAERIVGRLSLCLLSCAVWLVPLEAATINVDLVSQFDVPRGAIVVDGTDNLCSLREAIENANSDAATHADCEAGSGTDTIVLPTGAFFTVEDSWIVDPTYGATAFPYISSAIIISAGGAFFRSSGNCSREIGFEEDDDVRWFLIGATGDLTLEDALLQGGCANRSAYAGNGGGFLVYGDLTIRRSSFYGHDAEGNGGVIYIDGGGSAVVESSTFWANSAFVSGGAAAIQSGNMTIRNSTISGNETGGYCDGGIFGCGFLITLGGSGVSISDGQNLTLENVTFVDNLSSLGGGILALGGTISAKNVIFSESTCLDLNSIATWNASGSNFDNGTTCASLFGSNFQSNAELHLGSIQPNYSGSETATHPLGSLSEAIDAVAALDCSLGVDQRGEIRPQDGNGDSIALCDAGAVEMVRLAVPATIFVDEAAPGVGVVAIDGTDGRCSLREAIENANDTVTGLTHFDCEQGYASGSDTIVLPAGATFTLPDAAVSDASGNTGLPAISTAVTIQGNGAIIERDPALGCNLDGVLASTEFRLFLVASGVLTLRDVTMRGGCVDSSSNGILTGGSNGHGGAMFVAPTAAANLENSTVIGNHARMGGGVVGFGPVLIDRSTFTMNEASGDAGALFIDGGTLRNSTLSSNHAGSNGGALVTHLDNTIEHVTFLDNTFGTGGYGGGIYNLDALGGLFPHFRNVVVKNSPCVTNVDHDPTPAWTASGSNFDDGVTCASVMPYFTGNATLPLGPLADNGGPTMTHALLPGNAAIDAVGSADCTISGGATSVDDDQRGVIRPFDGDGDTSPTCDAGAFELATALSIGDATVTEDPTNATLTISRSGSLLGPVTVQIDTIDGTATAGADYTAITMGSATIPDGASSTTVDVAILEDLIDEGLGEEFAVSISNGPARLDDDTGLVTITDDDTAMIAISDATVTEGNTGTVDAIFMVTLSTPASTNVTVDVATADDTATAGSDYTAVPTTTLTFTPGETSKSVTVTVHGDAIDEGASETFFVNLSSPSHPIADAQGVGTITDDDSAGVTLSKIAASTSETGTTDSFTVVLDTEPTTDVILTLTAGDTTEGLLSDADESEVGSVTLTFTSLDWNVPQTITVTGVDDDLADGDQSYTIETDPAVSADPGYAGAAVADVSVINLDDETSSDDSDGDGVPNTVEDGGPNGGDGNDDGIPDSIQQHVATFPAANGNGDITLMATCELRQVMAIPTDGFERAPARLPYALVEFRLPCTSANLTVLYHAGDGWSEGMGYWKYGPETPGQALTTKWYQLPGVVFDTTTVAGNTAARARFTLNDGDIGDDTGVDGEIVDQGGPGAPVVAAIPTTSEWVLMMMAMALALAGVWKLRC